MGERGRTQSGAGPRTRQMDREETGRFTLGDLLRRHRERRGLTQEDLAACTDPQLSTDAISKIERGRRRPRRGTLLSLFAALELDTNERAAALRAWRTAPAPAHDRGEGADDAPAAVPCATAPADGLPSRHTSFIGRVAERARIAASLHDPACRLLTLVGPGGGGKTRLALQVAAEQGAAFAHGSHVVALAPLSAAAFVVPAIAGALGYRFVGPSEPQAQLLAYLRDKELLLVLDNFEHLPAAIDLVLALLERAPRVKLLVTSRQRLALQAEYVLDLAGLPVPPGDAVADVAEYAAVRLFVERARQARADFALSPATASSVVRICALVDGLPLGIELAAAWVRTHSCQEIAQEMERSLDFPRSPLRDVPERHRSLRAVFDYSWRLLPAEERAVLRRLSVFRGGFDADAAVAVAEAAQPHLLGLVDHALLRRGPGGRYDLHELVRRYAAERLAAVPDEGAATEARHGGHYALFLAAHADALQGGGQGAALAEIEAEIDNVRAAWRWAVAHGREREIDQGVEGLCRFYELRSWLAEGDEALERAAESLARAERREARDRRSLAVARGRVLAWRGRICHALARYQRSAALLDEGLAALRRHGGTAQDLALCLDAQGNNAGIRGDYAAAARLYRESLALSVDAGDRHGEALALRHLGGVAYDMGEFVAAKEDWERSLALRARGGEADGMAPDLNNLGEVAVVLGDYEEAARRSREALVLLGEVGVTEARFHPLANLGQLAEMRGDYAEARSYHRECLAIARQVGDGKGTAWALLHLAWTAQRADETGEAARRYRESLAIFEEIGYPRGIARCRNGLGRLAIRLGDDGEAGGQCRASLAIAERIGTRPEAAAAHAVLGQVAYRGGDAAAAAEHVGAAARSLVAMRALPALLDLLVDVATLVLAMGGGQTGSVSGAEREWRRERALDVLAFALQRPALSSDARVRAERHRAAAAPLSSAEAIASACGSLDEAVMRAIAAIDPRGERDRGADRD